MLVCLVYQGALSRRGLALFQCDVHVYTCTVPVHEAYIVVCSLQVRYHMYTLLYRTVHCKQHWSNPTPCSK